MGLVIRPFLYDPVITQEFGPTDNAREPALYGYPHFHTGVDYALPIGSCLMACASGVVAEVGEDPAGYGTFLILTHAGGFQSLLGHLSKVWVKRYQHVSQGRLVAASGNSGNSTGPHLHWGIRKDGRWEPPAAYLFGTGITT